jgi:hypothetical protein
MVCDLNGIILEMNDKAAEMYRKYGGMELVGKNLFDCHPEPARGKLKRLLETGIAIFIPLRKTAFGR